MKHMNNMQILLKERYFKEWTNNPVGKIKSREDATEDSSESKDSSPVWDEGIEK